MRVLIDTNILIDWLGRREEYYINAREIIRMCKDKEVDGCVAAHSITNIFYILRKELTFSIRKEIFNDISEILEIVGIGYTNIERAVNNNDFSDIEDCLQMECAREFNADYIVTRNLSDFSNSTIAAISPDDFIKIKNNA